MSCCELFIACCRVHSFLEYWGLINYGLSIVNNHKPSRLILPHTDAHFFALSETKTGLHPAESLRSSHKRNMADHCVDFNYDGNDTADDVAQSANIETGGIF